MNTRDKLSEIVGGENFSDSPDVFVERSEWMKSIKDWESPQITKK